MLLNGLGRFQNALGTFQEAPERESLIFQWFWEVLGGDTHARAHGEARKSGPPKDQFSKETPSTLALGQAC